MLYINLFSYCEQFSKLFFMRKKANKKLLSIKFDFYKKASLRKKNIKQEKRVNMDTDYMEIYHRVLVCGPPSTPPGTGDMSPTRYGQGSSGAFLGILPDGPCRAPLWGSPPNRLPENNCVSSFIHSFILPFIHSSIHSFFHSFIHSLSTAKHCAAGR